MYRFMNYITIELRKRPKDFFMSIIQTVAARQNIEFIKTN